MHPRIVLISSMLAVLLWFSASGFYVRPSPANSATDTLLVTLTEQQRANMIKSVHSKVKRLEEYTTLIAGKKFSGSAMDEKIRQSVELFLSEKNFVQSVSTVKNSNGTPKRY